MDTTRREFLQGLAAGIAASSLVGHAAQQVAALDSVAYIEQVYRSGAASLPPGVYDINRVVSLTGRPENSPSFNICNSIFNCTEDGFMDAGEPGVEIYNCLFQSRAASLQGAMDILPHSVEGERNMHRVEVDTGMNISFGDERCEPTAV